MKTADNYQGAKVQQQGRERIWKHDAGYYLVATYEAMADWANDTGEGDAVTEVEEGRPAALLTVDDAAQRLNATPRTVRNWCESGQLTAQKVGRDWIIDAAALDGFERPKVGRPTKN